MFKERDEAGKDLIPFGKYLKFLYMLLSMLETQAMASDESFSTIKLSWKGAEWILKCL